MVSSSFCLASVRENNWKNVCWKTALFSLFSTHAYHKEGGEVFILCLDFFFLRCHVFPMVSALDYSLLKHIVIMVICDFSNGTCHGRGALGCFDILIGKSTVLITVQY